jgi:hypothetical protein
MNYPQRTSAKPIVIEGETFHCYKTGLGITEWRSDGLRIGRNIRSTTFYAIVGGRMVSNDAGHPKRFQSLTAAMHAAVKVARHVG